jgi:cytochrome c biogenesis protein CcmG, thiol:disulfide interchange protein DsbE
VNRSSSLFAVLALVFMAGCHTGSRPPGIGTKAPDFTVKDSDKTVTLSQYEGKPVLLNFWATWCAPCIEEMPSLVQLQQRLQGKVTVIAVSTDVDDAAYHHFIKTHNVDLLTVRDGDQKCNTLYGTYKFPETYVIDSKGTIRRKFIGPVNWNDPQIIGYLNGL